MLISMIATIVAMLVIVLYMASSGMVTNASEVKITYEKVKYSYMIEKVVVDAVESLCQKTPTVCKGKESGGVITLTQSDLSAHLPTGFDFSNLNGGNINNIKVEKNYTTIKLTHNIPSDVARKIYLKHYQGKEFGISPRCVIGSETTQVPCNSNLVYHSYPTSLALRNALSL